MSPILANHPAVQIFALPEGHDIRLTNDKGYARTAPIALYIRKFPRDKYEFIRSFTFGCDGDDATNVWAYGNGAMITAEPGSKKMAVGCDLGDVLRIEGVDYRVDPDHNHNIKLTPVD